MSKKYPRTFHLPWSPGVSKDDRVAPDISYLLNQPIVITEKIDGSNTSLEFDNCYARTHSNPPSHPSFDNLKSLHASLKYRIPNNIQIFGEWCFAVHSIVYDALPAYFLMFGVRDLGSWLDLWYSWDETKQWAQDLGLYMVPELWNGIISSEKELQQITEELAHQPSAYSGIREGVVVRVANVFSDADFSRSVVKLVRKGHVTTDEHWLHKEIVKNKLRKT